MEHTLHHAGMMAKPSTRFLFNRRRLFVSTPPQRLRCCPKALPRAQQQQCSPAEPVWLQRTLSGVLTSAACLGLLLQAPVQAEELSIAFPASSNAEIRRAQQTMVESWAYVQALYLDPSFSHTDWTKALKDALADSFKAGSDSEVTEITNRLLATLGDPYTRLLQGDDAEALAAEEQGKIVATGLGLQPIILTGQLSTPPASDPAAAPTPDESPSGGNKPSMIAMATATGNADDAAAAAARSDGSYTDVHNESSIVAMAARATTTGTPTPSSSSSAGTRSAVEGYSGLGTSSSSSPNADDPAAAAADSPEVLLVSFVVSGSPAAAAGVQEGDVLLEVQGQPVAGRELKQVYKLLSKESDVTLLRQPELNSSPYTVSTRPSSSSSSSPIPPVTQITPADSAAPPGSSSSSSSRQRSIADLLPGYSPDRVYTVHLKPEVLDFAPVQYGVIDLGKTSDGSSGSSSSGGPQVGYLKLLTFAATAPQQVAEALLDMQQQQQHQQDLTQQSSNLQQQGTPGNSQPQQQQQLSGIILDLRDNPGGIVEAGVDIAVDFLHRGQVLCVAVDKSGEEERVVLPSAHTLTDLPLVILVNQSTASTSELVAGALHDELNAPLIGTTTYGKGRTQRVINLADGTSTLLVSTMKYFTPKHTEIDRVGLRPDVVCDPPEVVGQQWVGGKQDTTVVSLLEDPCIKLAAEKLAGTAKSVAIVK